MFFSLRKTKQNKKKIYRNNNKNNNNIYIYIKNIKKIDVNFFKFLKISEKFNKQK